MINAATTAAIGAAQMLSHGLTPTENDSTPVVKAPT